MTETIKQTSSEELIKAAKDDPASKAFLEYLVDRKRNRGDTNIARVSGKIASQTVDVNKSDVVKVFKKLESLNLGTIVYSRYGKPTSFQWGVNLRSVADAYKGKLKVPAPLQIRKNKPAEAVEEPNEYVVKVEVGNIHVSGPLKEIGPMLEAFKNMKRK